MRVLTATSADGQRWSEPAVLFPNVSTAQPKSLSRFKMDDGSVDLVVTSPPYNLKNSTGWGLKGNFHKSNNWHKAHAEGGLHHGYEEHDDNMPHEEDVEWQRVCLTEMMRLLSPKGAIFYNHKWRVQKGLIQNREDIVSDFPVRQILIWQRNGRFNFNEGYFLPT